jgi:geranylgeranyl pyrophosphate synthase
MSSPSEKIAAWTIPWLDPKIYRLDGHGSLPGLEKVIDETVMAGGKRLRPILMGEMGNLFGVPNEEILPLARAAEQIHSATLAHDDVIDASDTRRGVATLNMRLENRRAVLGGDYLLAEGIFTVTRQKNRAVIDALAATLKELVTGEILQNEARGRVDVTPEHLARIADLKTGSLFRWCCAVPPMLIGAGSETLRLIREFATHLGTAFQLIDDAIDFSTNSGKPVGQDLRDGLLNAVTLELLEGDPKIAPKLGPILKGEVAFEVPWTPSQIEWAEKKVRQTAGERLAGARIFLGDAIESARSEGLSVHEDSLLRIEFLIQKLEGRTR